MNDLTDSEFEEAFEEEKATKEALVYLVLGVVAVGIFVVLAEYLPRLM